MTTTKYSPTMTITITTTTAASAPITTNATTAAAVTTMLLLLLLLLVILLRLLRDSYLKSARKVIWPWSFEACCSGALHNVQFPDYYLKTTQTHNRRKRTLILTELYKTCSVFTNVCVFTVYSTFGNDTSDNRKLRANGPWPRSEQK